ncbi:MAG: hypothetical protein ACI9XR_001529 [Flavobacterium sp.]|jgi:hypothetical protein
MIKKMTQLKEKNIDLDKTRGRVATKIIKMMNLKMKILLISKRITISINKIHVFQ